MKQLALYSFISIYALVKNYLGISPGALSKKPLLIGFLIQSTLILLTITTFLLLSLIGLLTQIFLWGVDIFLKLKLGKNYGGRLIGQDVQFEVTDEKLPISAMVILNHNDDQQVAIARIQDLLKKCHCSCYKLSCTVRKCLGYPYYVKNQVVAEDCYDLIKVNDKKCLTKEEFTDYIQKNCMKDLINGKRLWYVKIFTQPVLWNKKSETKNQLVLKFIFRHCLADGISLIGLLKEAFYQEETSESIKFTKSNIKPAKPKFSLDDIHFYKNPLISEPNESAFDITDGERQIAFYVEEKIEYVPLVKQLKTKLRVGFTEVLIAALTASLAEVLSKRGKTMDKYTIGLLFRPFDEDLLNIINGTYDYNNLGNNTTMVKISVPVTLKKKSTMIQRIRGIKSEVEKAKRSVDGLFYNTIAKLGHLLPTAILKPATIFMLKTAVIASNVGGLKDGTSAGYDVEVALSYLPYCYEAGFRLAIFTKGDRFQLALTAKEDLLRDRNEAQAVLNGVFKYIDLLKREVYKK